MDFILEQQQRYCKLSIADISCRLMLIYYYYRLSFAGKLWSVYDESSFLTGAEFLFKLRQNPT